MIRSDSKYMAQVQGEHMLLIMHFWNYIIRPWYMMIHILLDPHSCFDSYDFVDDGHIQVIDLDSASRCLEYIPYMVYDSC